jgi:hypothetical protein
MRISRIVEALPEPSSGARTAESAQTDRKELAEKSVRAPEPWFIVPMRVRFQDWRLPLNLVATDMR